MMYLIVKRIILVALAAALAWALLRQVGAMRFLALWIPACGVATGLGALLLKTSTTGKITWKNWAAGYLMPWGYKLGRGRLGWIIVISWIIWSLIGVAVVVQQVLSAAPPTIPTTAPSDVPSAIWSWLLLAAWAANGAAVLYLLGTLVNNFKLSSTSGKSLLKIMALLVAVTAASVALHFNGYARVAVLVAAAPLLFVGLIIGALVSMVAIAGLSGKPIRWN